MLRNWRGEIISELHLRRRPVVLAALLLVFGSCASFSDGSGQTADRSVENCRASNCADPHRVLRHIPFIRLLTEPVGLGPCLPTTDQGQSVPCAPARERWDERLLLCITGWGCSRDAPQQKAPPGQTPQGQTVPVQGAKALGSAGAPSAAPRRTLAEFLLRLRSPETFAAVEQGGQW